MDNDENLTEKESLLLIEQMINSAKKSFQDNSFYFLFWGWLVFACAIVEYVLLNVFKHPQHYIAWLIMMPLGGVISGVYGYMHNRKSVVKTYTEEFLAYLWIAFIISLLIVLFFMSKIGYNNTYPILIILYGIGTFVSGGTMKFKPLIFGGVACWILAIACFYVSYSNQILLLSLSLLVSYIIPGHLLKANFKNA